MAAIWSIGRHHADALILNLQQEHPPPGVDVFEGTLYNGGLYRMFHEKSGNVDMIAYGRQLLTHFLLFPTVGRNVYVEHFQTPERTFVAVKVTFEETVHIFRSNYEIMGDFITKVNSEEKNKHVKGVFLPVDLANRLRHPYIFEEISRTPVNEHTFTTASRGKKGEALGISSRSRRSMKYYLKPIINIFGSPKSKDDPPTSLYVNSSKVKITQERRLVVDIWRQVGVREYTIVIPDPSKEVFKPQNLVRQHDYVFQPPRPVFDQLLHKQIVVDVSSTSTQEREVFILSNLRRGDWLYSQYAVVPHEDQAKRFVSVKDSAIDMDIYQVEGDQFVTHVEVFKHIEQGWQYVVVHIQLKAGYVSTDVTKIYKRVVDEVTTGYFDMEFLGTDMFLEMLHNISSEPQPSDVAADVEEIEG
ncbi:uncharacterized protein BcabD6B2_57670 [Babesia caballi]|uniref:Uncharacterized protein n=1 Tax=Babesia caballi TaxID=5871 RepID=A0AAV4M1I9_BABCB|nr:hypothetical protein, conserved [Babesia caballi]